MYGKLAPEWHALPLLGIEQLMGTRTQQAKEYANALREARDKADLQLHQVERLGKQKGTLNRSTSTFSAWESGSRLPPREAVAALHDLLCSYCASDDAGELRGKLDSLEQEARDAEPVAAAGTHQSECQLHIGRGALDVYNGHVQEQLVSSHRFIMVANSGWRWVRQRSHLLQQRFEDEDKHSTFVVVGPYPVDGPAGVANDLVNRHEGRAPYTDRTPNQRRVQDLLGTLLQLGATDENVSIYFTTFITPPWTAVMFDTSLLLEPHYMSPQKKVDAQVPFFLVYKTGRHDGWFEYILADINQVLGFASQQEKWPQGVPPIIKGNVDSPTSGSANRAE